MANQFLQPIITHLIANSEAYITAIVSAATVLCIAAIGAMPALVPKTAQDLWTWMRETLQTATPVNRMAQHAALLASQQAPTGNVAAK